MSNKNETQCETDQSECKTNQSKYTQVKTVYARTAVILLAINFCLTGYVLTGMMEIQTEQADSSQAPQTLSTGSGRADGPSTPTETPQTLEKEDN
jgi:predicted RND superfamily exporter protein